MGDFKGSLDSIFEEFKSKVKEMNAAKPFWNMVMNFVHSVNWTERWIQAILSCHIVLIVTTLSCRKILPMQLCIFAFGTVVIFFSENLNALGGEYWEEFATQPYFDKHGIFFTTMVSGPLLILLIFVLINYLLHVVGVMVQMKRKQLQAKAKQQARAANAEVKSTQAT